MTTQLIPVFTGTINHKPVQLVDARLLHLFLESAQDFSNWIKNRIGQYSFIENKDYLLNKIIEQVPSGKKYKKDYHLTLNMAKELSMVERNEKGKQARRYFIEMEQIALQQSTLTKASAFEDLLPELLPFQRLNSALLSELRRMSKSLAQAYLLECGVTPEYVNSQLAKLGPVTTGTELTAPQSNVMPLALLKAEIPRVADEQDQEYYYLRTGTFATLCGDYDSIETARMLRDLKILKCHYHSLKSHAPRSLFKGRRPSVYAVRKNALNAAE